MGKRRDNWRATFVALGEAMIEVLRAELEVIAEAWKRSGRELAIVLAILATACCLAVACLPPLLVVALLAGLVALGWPLWGAALAVAAVVALVAGVLARYALWRLEKRCESPVATIKDRVSDHVAWWNEKILRDDRTLGEHDETDDDDGDRSAG